MLRPFHQASWNEPVILEQGSPGERGYVPPPVEPEIAAAGDGLSDLPEGIRRSEAPALPELAQGYERSITAWNRFWQNIFDACATQRGTVS